MIRDGLPLRAATLSSVTPRWRLTLPGSLDRLS